MIISSQVKLDCRMGYCVIRGKETKRILLEEIQVLVIENPMVSMTGCLLEALIKNKTKIIFCDSKHNPMGELIPHHGSHDSSAKIRKQIAWKDDVKSWIWQRIVVDKISMQQTYLKKLKKVDEAYLLESYISQVEPMDKTNREGHAAKVYFNAVFGLQFTREADTPINAALNYGYSIMLSLFNREISANGYLTQIGIFHNNVFNHFNLGSDIMEPFRVLVDMTVHNMAITQFEKEEKYMLWNIMNTYVNIDGSSQVLANAVSIFSKSVFDAIDEGNPDLIKSISF